VGVCQNSNLQSNACNVWYLLGTYTLDAGTQYIVTLNGYTSAGSLPSGNAGRSDAIKWEGSLPVGTPPSITQQPAAQNVCAGATAGVHRGRLGFDSADLPVAEEPGQPLQRRTLLRLHDGDAYGHRRRQQ